MSEIDAAARPGVLPAVLHGNRLALAGAVLYLLEWVAIIGAQAPGPYGPGTAPVTVVHDYAGHAGGSAFSAAWFAVVLVGRVLFIAGIKASLRDRPQAQPWLDWALGAMAVSVAVEVIGYGLAATAARLASDGAAQSLVVGLDDTSFMLVLMIWGPAGVAVLAAGWAMLRSGLFPAWLGWLPLVAGVAAVAGCVVGGVGFGRSSGTGAADGVTTVAALGLWVWMLGTGIVLFRRAGSEQSPGVAAAAAT